MYGTGFKVARRTPEGLYESVFAKGRYRRIYAPGLVVTAEPSSIGILLFKTKGAALRWMKKFRTESFQLLEVRLLAPPVEVAFISNFQEEEGLDHWYEEYSPREKWIPQLIPSPAKR